MSERADQCAPMFLCSSEHFGAQKFIAEFVTTLGQIHRWIVLSLCPTIHRWIVGPSLKLVVTTYEFEFPAELSDHHNHHAWADSPLNCPEPVMTIHRWIVGPSLKLVVTKYYEFEFTAELSDHHNQHAHGQIHRWIVLSLCPTIAIHRWTFASWPAMRQLVGRFVLSA